MNQYYPSSNYKLRTLMIFCAILIVGCKTKGGDPFALQGIDFYGAGLGKRITAYQEMKFSDKANSKTGKPALYIDFSAGINNAFKTPAISALMTECFNTVLTEKFDVYKLGSNQITPLAISNTTELGQKVSDPREYLDIWAPIQATVEKITAADNDALLITDFEEWQDKTEITTTAYLKIPFLKWLSKGNSIHFFIADYREGKVDKHIYFTVFSCGSSNSTSLIAKLEPKLRSLNARFDLSGNAYKLTNDYPGEKTGGIFYDKNGKTEVQKNVLDLKENYINGLKIGSPYEFYPLGVDWKTINDTHNSYKMQGQFNDLFRNLFIDLSNEDSYSYKDFDVKTYDISADYESYSQYREITLHKPKLTKGSNGESEFAGDEKDAIALTCYNTDGSIKSKWKYKPMEYVSLPEIFVLNKNLFNNTRRSDKGKTEFAISFDPRFNLKNIVNPKGLLKADIVLNTAEANINNPLLDKFKWINAKGVSNLGLYESIKNTLQELEPANKVIYSYYIKTQQ